jgi:DNA modification methylase
MVQERPEEGGYAPAHINTSLETANNPPRYGAIKYYGGKPSRVWSQYIEAYTSAGETVLDPFCGQGIAVGEAVRLGRRGIGFDLQASAAFISREIFNKVEEESLISALGELEASIGNDISELYSTNNRDSVNAFDYNLLTTSRLKDELNARGLSMSGTRDELITRIENFDNAQDDDARFALIPNRGLGRLYTRYQLDDDDNLIPGTRDERIAFLRGIGYEHPEPLRFPTHCNAIAFIWEGADKDQETLTEVRYDCLNESPGGGHRVSNPVEQQDFDNFRDIYANRIFFDENSQPLYPIPDGDMAYSTGSGFVERQRIRHLSDLYTDRNLAALAALRHHILQIENLGVQNALMYAFQSILWLTTRRPPNRINREHPNRSRPYSATIPIQSYNVPPDAHMEMNVWYQFTRKVFAGREPVTGAHEDKEDGWHSGMLVENYDNLSEENPAMIHQGDCRELMAELPDDSVDFIITDPPYGGVVQYSEMEYSRGAWLDGVSTEDLLSSAEDHEIIINAAQGKDAEDYVGDLREVFQECSRVLRPDRHIVVTFTHTSLAIRNALFRAAASAGFQLERITWQEGSRPTQRATWDEGIALEGDYYIRFVNRWDVEADDGNIAEVDTPTYERIIQEEAIATIVHNAMPTSLNSLLSRVEGAVSDRLRAEQGLFPPLETRTLEEILSDAPELVSTPTGYWLTNPRVHRMELPLDRRIEGLITQFVSLGDRSYTEIHRYIMQSIRDSLTPTRHDVVDTLNQLCDYDNGRWSLRPQVEAWHRMHEQIVYNIADIGSRMNSRVVAIAVDEHGKEYQGQRLDQQLTLHDHPTLGYSEEEVRAISRIDIIWMTNSGHITHCFEVENSTAIAGAIMRMSNVREHRVGDRNVSRVIVIPDTRVDEARRIANSRVMTDWLSTAEHGTITYSQLEGYLVELGNNPPTLGQIDDLIEPMVPQVTLDQFIDSEE